jgi:hypothetical protein
VKKALAIFLLCLLPIQTVWASVAGYCQHEIELVQNHLGHHEHEHQNGGVADKEVDKKIAQAVVLLDSALGTSDPSSIETNDGLLESECSMCHAQTAAVVTDVRELQLLQLGLSALPTAPMSLPPQNLLRPERPNWNLPAAR